VPVIGHHIPTSDSTICYCKTQWSIQIKLALPKTGFLLHGPRQEGILILIIAFSGVGEGGILHSMIIAGVMVFSKVGREYRMCKPQPKCYAYIVISEPRGNPTDVATCPIRHPAERDNQNGLIECVVRFISISTFIFIWLRYYQSSNFQ
jgi:hypothetical protein